MNTFYLKIPNEKMLEDMIEEEERIRNSDYYRNKCTEIKYIPNGWLSLTENIQRDIVKLYSFTDEMSCNVACNMMRRAHILFPNNLKFKNIPQQVKYNKANKGKYVANDDCPNVSLYDLDGTNINLHKLMDERPTLIFAGSQT